MSEEVTENEANTLLLTTLADLVPASRATHDVVAGLRGLNLDGINAVADLLENYGKLINVLGIAIEYDDATPSMSLYERLSAAYYEEVNSG